MSSQRQAFVQCIPLSCRPKLVTPRICQRRHALLAPRFNPSRLQNQKSTIVASIPTLPALPASTATVLAAAATASTPFAIWAVLLSAATLGLTSQSTRWGTALSPPLVSTLTTMVFSNLNLLPLTHPVYTTVSSFIVPLAVPLLLLGADLRRVMTETGRLLRVFIVGTIATCIGTMVAWYVVPLVPGLGDAAWKIAAALTARHIGGAVNYVAVADATGAPPDVVTAALTADNLVVALYFILLLVLARNVTQPDASVTAVGSQPSISSSSLSSQFKGHEQGEDGVKDSNDNDLPQDEDVTSASAGKATVSVADAGVAVSLSAAMCAFAAFISKLLPVSLGVIPVSTAIVLFVATVFRDAVRPYKRAASAVGVFFMQVFFAVAGAGGSFALVMRRAPVLFVWSVVQLAVHLAVMLAVGFVLRFHRAEMLIASNANVGGPSTAAAMAGAKQWDRMVVPALLVGVLGYSVATFLSLGLGYGVLRLL